MPAATGATAGAVLVFLVARAIFGEKALDRFGERGRRFADEDARHPWLTGENLLLQRLLDLALAGLPTDRFLFVGFLPPKAKARSDAIAEVAAGVRIQPVGGIPLWLTAERRQRHLFL